MTDSLHAKITEAYEQSTAKEEARFVNEDNTENDQEPTSKPISDGENDEKEQSENNDNHDNSSANDDFLDDYEIKATKNWSEEDRELFKTFDAKGREFLLRRYKEMQADYTKKQQSLSEHKNYAEAFKESVQPYEGYLKEIGISPKEAINNLLATEMKLRTSSPKEKARLLHILAKEYGAEFDPNEEPEDIDDKTRIILDELQQLKTQQQRLLDEKVQNQNISIHKTIENFASTKDENGRLKYPYFDDVRKDMGVLVEIGKASTLEEAYEQAVLLNKDLRNEYISGQTRNHNKKEELRQQTAASKKAAFNVKSGSSGAISEPKPQLSLRKTIEELVGKALDSGNRF